MDFHSRESSLDRALLLRVISTGTNGDSKAVNKLFEELMKYGQ
jgi:hypothetical protein